MALEYTLTIEDNIKGSVIEEYLTSILPFNHCKSQSSLDIQIMHIEKNSLHHEMIKEEFNFSPSLYVNFHLDKFGDNKFLRKQLITMVTHLLEKVKGDATLLFTGGVIVLLRSQKNLIINDIEGFWNEELLKILPNPYQMKTFENI